MPKFLVAEIYIACKGGEGEGNMAIYHQGAELLSSSRRTTRVVYGEGLKISGSATQFHSQLQAAIH